MWGAVSGIAVAVLLGVAILTAYYQFSSSFYSGNDKYVFEGVILLAACCMITPVSFGMLRMLSTYNKWTERLEKTVSKHKAAVAADVGGFGEAAAADGTLPGRALFFMAFTATLREGIEAVVFITGVSQGKPQSIPLPGILGLFLGSVFSYLVFFSAKPLDVRPFMYGTAFVMFAIGAGLLSRGFNSFQLAGSFGPFASPHEFGPDYSYSATVYMPAVVTLPPAWVNVKLGDFRDCCAANAGQPGFFTIIRAVFGYSDAPTRLEIITYMAYWGFVFAVCYNKHQKGVLFGKSPSLPVPICVDEPVDLESPGGAKGAKGGGGCDADGCEETEPCDECRKAAPPHLALSPPPPPHQPAGGSDGDGGGGGGGSGGGSGGSSALRHRTSVVAAAAAAAVSSDRLSSADEAGCVGSSARGGGSVGGGCIGGGGASEPESYPAGAVSMAAGASGDCGGDGGACAGDKKRKPARRRLAAAARRAARRLAAARSSLPRAARARPRAALAAAAAAVALFLGLLLGLLLRPAPPPPQPVAAFTLVLTRNASLSLPRAPGKPQFAVNGQWPGPTLRAPLGALWRVTIVNELGGGEVTAVHWHGMRHDGAPFNDGVVGVSQCPITPTPGANAYTVEFTPDRAGTFWCVFEP